MEKWSIILSENSLVARIIKLEHEIEQIKAEISEIKPFKEQLIRQDEHYNQIMESLTELKEDIRQIKGRGAKFWDFSITAIISAIIGFFISKVFGV